MSKRGLNYYVTESELDKIVWYFLKRDQKRNALTIMLLFYCGMRISELRNIKKQDIDFEQKIIYLNVTKLNKPRIVPFPYFLKPYIRKYIKSDEIKDDEYLFHIRYGKTSPMSRCAFGKQLKQTCKELRIKHIWPHLLRKSFGIYFIKKTGQDGLPILQRLLGHSSATTTIQYYLPFCTEDVKSKYAEVFEEPKKVENNVRSIRCGK